MTSGTPTLGLTSLRFVYIGLLVFLAYFGSIPGAHAEHLSPLLERGHEVDWWFAYKFNAASFPGCGAPPPEQPESSKRVGPFGGTVKEYPAFGQQFAVASSEERSLKKGFGCIGSSTIDPLAATFEQIYDGKYYYVVWNDQFYLNPKLKACGTSDSCGAPWGHSKGMLAWDNDGAGVVLQVTTPSWPAAASKELPRKGDGNTLGCVRNNNLKFAQHFFALKLSRSDVLHVLEALINASVVTDPNNRQLVNNGGPIDVQHLVSGLGKKSDSSQYSKYELSSKVILISKPSELHVPPWQMVSAVMGGVALRPATWWAAPKIYSTKARQPTCWEDNELDSPGPVAIATSGEWEGVPFKLGGSANHAKIGVSTSGTAHYTILGDMNQQGMAFTPGCERSQNGRGGLFFVIDDPGLFKSVTELIDGDTAPTRPPKQ
jgi:hypothetical protein